VEDLDSEVEVSALFSLKMIPTVLTMLLKKCNKKYNDVPAIM
jgi:hypothetical protein